MEKLLKPHSLLKGSTKKHRSYPGQSSVSQPCGTEAGNGCFKSRVVVFWVSFQAERLFSFRTIAELLISLQGVLSPLLTWGDIASGVPRLPAGFQVIRQAEEGREQVLLPQKQPVRMHAGVIYPARLRRGRGECCSDLQSSLNFLLPCPPAPPPPQTISSLCWAGLHQACSNTHTHSCRCKARLHPALPCSRLFL